MARKTKELKESCKGVALSLIEINVYCHKITIIPETESYFSKIETTMQWHMHLMI